MPQYIPPKNLIDFLKIKDYEKFLSNHVLEPETNNIQVKTSSLLISTKTTDSVNRNSSEFQQVVQTSKETAQLKHKLKQFGIKFDPKQNRLISPVEGFRPDRNPQPRYRRRNLPGNSPQVPPKFAPRIITNLGANNGGDHGNDDYNPQDSKNLNVPIAEQPQQYIPPKKKPEITKIDDWSFDAESENSYPVISQAEVKRLIDEAGLNEKICFTNEAFSSNDHQLAKKIYHAKEFGINYEDYGISKIMLERMEKYSLYEYLGRGGNLPCEQFFIDYRNGIDKFLNDPNTIIIPGFHVQGKKIIKVHLAYNRQRRIVLCANRVSGDLIAGQRVGKPQFQRSVDKRIYLATPKKIKAVNEHLAQ